MILRNNERLDAQCGNGWEPGPGGKCVRARSKVGRALVGKAGVDAYRQARASGRGKVRAGLGAVGKSLQTNRGVVGGAGLAGKLTAGALATKKASSFASQRMLGGGNNQKALPTRTMSRNPVARGVRRMTSIDVQAKRKDSMNYESDYALGYLAARGIRYDGADPVGYLAGYLQFRQDADKAKCDPEKGWEKGPGGKCVRIKGGKKKGGGMAGKLAAGALGAAAVGGAAYVGYKGRNELKEGGRKIKEELSSAGRDIRAERAMTKGDIGVSKIKEKQDLDLINKAEAAGNKILGKNADFRRKSDLSIASTSAKHGIKQRGSAERALLTSRSVGSTVGRGVVAAGRSAGTAGEAVKGAAKAAFGRKKKKAAESSK